MKKQTGITFLGFVIVAAFLLSIVMAGIIVVPDYIEYFGVKKIIQHIGSEPNFSDMTKTDIVTEFDKGAQAGYVTLKVFDMIGREVAVLVNENKTAGSYEVTFDASKLSGGIYIYHLKANDFVSSKKMILMK